MKFLTGLFSIWMATTVIGAEIKTKTVEYDQGGTVLEGFAAYDASMTGKRPAVLIVHQWKGLTDYEKRRARMLAELGYNVLAIDVYGKGVRADNPKDAAALAGKYKGDRGLLRARARAGLEWLTKNERTDTRRVAAMGYCFG